MRRTSEKERDVREGKRRPMSEAQAIIILSVLMWVAFGAAVWWINR